MRIDCEAITDTDTQGAAMAETRKDTKNSAWFLATAEVVQGVTASSDASNQPQADAQSTAAESATNLTQEHHTDKAIFPTAQAVLNFIAYKIFKAIDPAKPEEINGFLEYMEKVRKVLVIECYRGSLIITVKCSSLQVLEELWADYCSGRLNEMAQKFLVTEDVLTVFGLIEVKLTVTIAEEEYRAVQEYFLNHQGRFTVAQWYELI